MFCSNCGKEIPDQVAKCPECGKNFASEEATTAETASAPKVQADVNVGAFIKGFFKDPVEAVVSRAKDSYWLWGLISLSAFAIVYFLRFAFDYEIGAGNGFALMFSLLCGLTALIFSLFLLQDAMKLTKKSLPAIISAVGLSMIPMVPIIVFASIMDYIFLAEGSYMSVFLLPLLGVGYLFSAFIIFLLYLDSEDKDYRKSMMLVVISYAISIFIHSLFSGFIWNSII